MTNKIIKLLLLLNLVNLASPSLKAAEQEHRKSNRWQAEEQALPFEVLQLPEDSSSPEFVKCFSVDTLFKVHRLPEKLIEEEQARDHHNQGIHLLKQQKWDEAIKYLACADYFRFPQVIWILYIITYCEFYKGCPDELRKKLDKAFNEAQSGLGLPADASKEKVKYKLGVMYQELWRLNHIKLTRPIDQANNPPKVPGKPMESISWDQKPAQQESNLSVRATRRSLEEDLVPLLPDPQESRKSQ